MSPPPRRRRARPASRSGRTFRRPGSARSRDVDERRGADPLRALTADLAVIRSPSPVLPEHDHRVAAARPPPTGASTPHAGAQVVRAAAEERSRAQPPPRPRRPARSAWDPLRRIKTAVLSRSRSRAASGVAADHAQTWSVELPVDRDKGRVRARRVRPAPGVARRRLVERVADEALEERPLLLDHDDLPRRPARRPRGRLRVQRVRACPAAPSGCQRRGPSRAPAEVGQTAAGPHGPPAPRLTMPSHGVRRVDARPR